MSKVVQIWDNPGEYRFVVPPGVTSIRMEAYGATGGILNLEQDSAGNINTGRVGYAAGDFTAVPGDILYVLVGGPGGAAQNLQYKRGTTFPGGVGGFNGGGNGGSISYSSKKKLWTYIGAGGGGASDVRLLPSTDVNTLLSRILVAGGQGGNSTDGKVFRSGFKVNPTSPVPPYKVDQNEYDCYADSDTPGIGGYGGGLVAGQGGFTSKKDYTSKKDFSGGFPGSQAKGGDKGLSVGGSNSSQGTDGALGQGGSGGNLSSSKTDNASFAGGGGGGGYYGGGGGSTSYDNSSKSGGGGGGGSNYLLSSTLVTAAVGNGLGRDVAALANQVSVAHAYHGAVNPSSGAQVDSDTGAVILSSSDRALQANYTLKYPSQTSMAGRVVFSYYVEPTTTITSPRTGSQFDPTKALNVGWQFSSIDPEAKQAGYQVAHRVHGTSTWLVDKSAPAGGEVFGFSYPAGTFTAGTTYDIGALAWDDSGSVGTYGYITVDALTSTATLDDPASLTPAEGAVVTTDPFTVAWTLPAGVVDEADYQVQVLNSDQETVLDTGQTPVQRLNLIPNTSAETDVSLWQVSAGAGTLTQNTTAAYCKIGTKSFKMAWAAVDSPYVSAWWVPGSVGIPTIPGETYVASMWVTQDSLVNAPTVVLKALNAGDGSVIGTSATVALAADAVANTWHLLTLAFIAQTSRTLLALAAVDTPVAGVATYFDAVIMERRAARDTTTTTISGDGAYFNGSNYTGAVAGTASWVGTANLSPSKFVPTAGNTLSKSVPWGQATGSALLRFRYSEPDYAAWASRATLTLGSGGGNLSGWSEHAFVVNAGAPDPVSVGLYSNDEAGTITLYITGGSDVEFCDVYRQDITHEGEEIRVATRLPSDAEWTDYTPATDTQYAYRVRAFSSTGGYADAS